VRKLKPALDGDWRLIGRNPDMRGIIPGAEEFQAQWEGDGERKEHNAAVDHHLFRGPDGAFHLWGCIRNTVVGRVLYHWETDDIETAPWRETGEVIRCDFDAGECIKDRGGKEWLQSPYFVHVDGTYYMFYGGHSSGLREDGSVIPDDTPEDTRTSVTACQICLMTSSDGRSWERHRGATGSSRLFMGPGAVRDPCVIRVGDEWVCYYAGFSNEDLMQHAFYARTSKDLVTWSEYKMIHQDLSLASTRWATECPHVVFRDGYYYLFRTENYYEKKTHVFRSADPFDFGIGDASDKYVGIFPAAAVEVYEIDGQEYVTSSHDPRQGEFMAKLTWVNE